ncbi:MAG: diguanylate cyclase [Psychromonas sp.]
MKLAKYSSVTSGQKNSRKSECYIGRRHSLATIISTAFIGIVILFMAVMSLSYYRLINLQSVMTDITEGSFPEITHSINLHDQANQLLYLSDRLTGANNQAMLRTANKDIETKVQQIRKQNMRQQSHSYLASQLDVIDDELSNLSDLVEQKIDIQAQLIDGQNHMLTLHEKMFKLFQISSMEENTISASITWSLAYSEVITLTNQAFIKPKLQEVRLSLENVSTKINSLHHMLATLPKSQQNKSKEITFELWQLLLGGDGLLLMKLEQLRINGRVIGRSNFVKNLIDDFSRVVEFKSYQTIESVLLETTALEERAITETKLIGFATLMVLLGLFSVIYFIKKRFVERVVNLNANIMMRLKGDNIKLDVTGNDEISDIADAFNIFADKIEQQNKVLHELSFTDGLTGLANRRALDQRLNNELLTAKRNQSVLIVMIMDIDFFKQYNDFYGHLAGDDNLKIVSTMLSRCNKRSTDFVARYGGDEFVFILPDTDFYGAQKLADDIIAEMKILNILHQASKVASHVTLSIGIASSENKPELDPLELIAKADIALY